MILIFAAKKYLRNKKTGLEWSIYARHLREASLNGLSYWLTGIFVFCKSYSEALQREKNQLILPPLQKYFCHKVALHV